MGRRRRGKIILPTHKNNHKKHSGEENFEIIIPELYFFAISGDESARSAAAAAATGMQERERERERVVVYPLLQCSILNIRSIA